ncbi:hypothetical protein NVQ99_13565, partial [Staphylococcus pseudintermedius]|nr:hypothetical protein [Staphylococcus pseudintermedius]
TRLPRDQLNRKIHQRFNKCNSIIKALVSCRFSPWETRVQDGNRMQATCSKRKDGNRIQVTCS